LPAYEEYEPKELLIQLAAGSEKAFSQLFHQYSDKLYSFIYTMSGSTHIAEDTVQEVFLKIWNRRSEAGNINNFDHYLFRTAHNHVLNVFKRVSRESLILEELARNSTDQEEKSYHLESKETNNLIKNAVNKLPNKQRQVYIMSREQGLKQAEISSILKITIPTVKSHITQAIQFIRKECRSLYPVTKVFLVLLTSLFK
jgi:RNA polymerase sigma-70 factor (ECF subfamily)